MISGRSLAVLMLIAAAGCEGGEGAEPPPGAGRPFDGYTLYAPIMSTKTWLVDMDGKPVHSWSSEFEPGQSVYLLPNGHLLRTANPHPAESPFHGGGAGGRVEEYTWEGELVWTFELATDRARLHHDIEPLPNGNVLMIAWERKTAEEAIAAGRDPKLVGEEGLWSDYVLEVRPTGKSGGEVVWEWHAFDHLVQDRDRERANYGELAGHPGRLDANARRWAEQTPPEEWDRLGSLGYLGGAPPRRKNPDWLHTNSIDWNPERDEIALSVLGTNELWIIDHGVTTEEAKGPAGDLLYRWGNPAAYGMGGPEDRRLFAQHDVRWIPEDRPGAGHLLVFDNGRGRPDGDGSSVDEIVPPLGEDGRYAREEGRPFGPAAPAWTCDRADGERFFSDHISGAERLPNGNTLICVGAEGRMIEVTPSGKVVWSHRHVATEGERPRRRPGRPPQGRRPFPGPRGPGGPRGGGPPRGGPLRGGPGGPGGPPGNENHVFRAHRVARDDPAVAGRLPAVAKPD